MSKVKLLPHNQLTFEYILELSKNNKKICIPQATGTGKTWLEARILEEWSDKKAIIFAPRNEILEETCSILDDNDITNAETITYQTFNNMSDEDIVNMEVDIVLFDEAHRILATEWYKKIQILIDSHPNSIIFGLTATPIRPDGRDIRKEVFNNCSTHYITLEEAIVRDIVKMPIYVSALYTFDEMVRELQNKIKNSKNSKEEKSELKRKLKAAKKNLELSMGVPTIIKKYITDYNGKYLVFCRDTDHLEESILLVNRWFRESGYKDEIVNYRIGSNYSDSNKQLEMFKKDNNNRLKLLFSIEKLNEGVHIPTVDGVILLRPTSSNVIYYQQIGRCIRADTNKRPVILDLVNNMNGIKIPLRDGINKCIEARKNGGYPECSNDIEIDNYSIIDCLHETASVFSEIENELYTEDWKEREVQILYKYFPDEGMNVKNRLPGRTKTAIQSKASKLGLKSRNDLWTQEEIELLKKYYPLYGGSEEMLEYINRPLSSIKSKANELKIKAIKGIFSKEEDELIKKYYPIEGSNVYKRLNNKTQKQCRGRARNLGISFENNNVWTKKEDNIIRKYYIEGSASVIDKIPHKTSEQIMRRASKLGVRIKTPNWTKDEDNIIKKYYPIEKTNVYKRLNNRSKNACMSRARILGVNSKNNSEPWSENDYKILREYYPKIGNEVSDMLNRSKQSCATMASKLKIKRESNSKYKYVHKYGNRFCVEFCINGKNKRFGTYYDEDEAGKVALEKAKEYGKI